MRNQFAAIAFVLAIAIGAGLGYLGGVTNSSRSMDFSTTTTTAVSVSTVTETSILGGSTSQPGVCVTNINSPPEPQYVSILRQIIVISSFVQYSNGRCWTWEGTFQQSGPGYSKLNFVFDHFSNQIIYPCGYPVYAVDAAVYVVPSESGGNVTSVSIRQQPSPSAYSCPPLTVTIYPMSFAFVSWNSSGQTVSLKLLYPAGFNTSLRSLEARIYNSSWSYVIAFSGVNSTHPLQPGASVVQEALVPGTPFRDNIIYDVTATGTYSNGTRIISNFKVQLQT